MLEYSPIRIFCKSSRIKADGYIGLQDEMYRIYADQMVDGERKKNEERERKELYQSLRDRAKYKYETAVQNINDLQEKL